MIAFISKAEMCKANLALTNRPRPRFCYQSEKEFRTNIDRHPWMVTFLILPEHNFIGSASIITKRWVITTAYSVEKVANVSPKVY